MSESLSHPENSPQPVANDPVFADLANRYLDNSLSPAELETFNAALRNDEPKRQAFKWLCITHCALARELDEHKQVQLQLLQDAVDADDAHLIDLNDVAILPAMHVDPNAIDDEEPVYNAPPPAIPIPPPEKAKKRWYRAAGLLVPLLIAGWYFTRPGPAKSMARIETSLDAHWVSPQDMNLHTGSALPPGVHTLGAGVIKLVMKGDNEIVLQGPSEFEVVGESSIKLARGKLCARMGPKTGADHCGLTVFAPDLKAVDLGTEFGVDVTEGTSTHLEVFEGSVEADGIGSNNSRTLHANQAVRVTVGSNEIRNDQPRPSEFLRTAEVDALAENLEPNVKPGAEDNQFVTSLSDTDIGGPQTAGESILSGGIWNVTADGRGFQTDADQFHFARTSVKSKISPTGTMTGQTMVVQLVRSARLSQTSELPANQPPIRIRVSPDDPESAFVATRKLISGNQPFNSSSGIMFRNSEDAGSPFVAVVMTGGAGVELICRDTAGAPAKIITKIPHTYAPIWLRLDRADTHWSAYSSDDGMAWTPRGTCNAELSKDAHAGLAVSSNTDNIMTTAAFSHLALTAGGNEAH